MRASIMTASATSRETMMKQSDGTQIRKSPVLAGFLSVLPGAGQTYVGHYVAGFTNILVIGSLMTLLDSGQARPAEPFFGMLLAFFWIFNIVDAVRRARIYNLHAVGIEEPMPTDSPLVGGVLLAFLGLVLTLTVTFDVDLDWLGNVWPLGVLGAGIYLILRYRKAKEQLEREAMTRTAHERVAMAPSPPPPPPPFVPPTFTPSAAAPVASMTASGGDEDYVEEPGEAEAGEGSPDRQ
ncbi:MAG: hypothetical protein R3E97_06600 [Candidatus Eisenbacteria bacterium]